MIRNDMNHPLLSPPLSLVIVFTIRIPLLNGNVENPILVPCLKGPSQVLSSEAGKVIVDGERRGGGGGGGGWVGPLSL